MKLTEEDIDADKGVWTRAGKVLIELSEKSSGLCDVFAYLSYSKQALKDNGL